MLSLLSALADDCTKESAEWCALVLAVLAAVFGAISHLGRHTFHDGSAR